MADATIDVKQLRDVTRKLEKLGAEVKDLKGALGDAADIAADKVRSLAPQGASNKLVGSVRVGKAKGSAKVRAGNKAAYYARFVNNGHRTRGGGFVSGVKFLERGVDASAPAVVERINTNLGKVLRGLDLS